MKKLILTFVITIFSINGCTNLNVNNKIEENKSPLPNTPPTPMIKQSDKIDEENSSTNKNTELELKKIGSLDNIKKFRIWNKGFWQADIRGLEISQEKITYLRFNKSLEYEEVKEKNFDELSKINEPFFKDDILFETKVFEDTLNTLKINEINNILKDLVKISDYYCLRCLDDTDNWFEIEYEENNEIYNLSFNLANSKANENYNNFLKNINNSTRMLTLLMYEFLLKDNINPKSLTGEEDKYYREKGQKFTKEEISEMGKNYIENLKK